MLPPPELVIDECLDKRLASELTRRGRMATSVSALGLRGLDDPELLHKLAQRDHPCVIVTADEAMPLDWMDALTATGTTLAVVDHHRSHTYGVAQWYCDVVHRWAHVMPAQPTGTVHRYSVGGHRAWKPRSARSASRPGSV